MATFIQFTGPLYIGASLNWCLFGAFLVQLYDYIVECQKNDRFFIKATVYFVFALEILQLVFMNHTVWGILVAGWGNPNSIIHTPWSSSAHSTLNGAVSVTVQLFFAWRILAVGKHRLVYVISAIIACVALMQFAASIAVSIKFTLLARAPETLKTFKAACIVWLGGSLACDLLIAGTMVTLLAQSKKRTVFSTTEKIIDTLIINTIETGAVTAICALIELVLFLTHPDNFLHIATEFILGRIFSNVLLATLNGRKRLIGSASVYGTTHHQTTSFPLNKRNGTRDGDTTKVDVSRSDNKVHINVHTKTDIGGSPNHKTPEFMEDV